MNKLAVFGVFLTILAWNGPSFACQSWQVLTCGAREKPKAEAQPSSGWRNEPVRIFGSDGKLKWKGRVETDGRGVVRVYDKRGKLIKKGRIE